jgi:hypothetical protein
LTVSFDAHAWLRVSCASGRVSSAERLVAPGDLDLAHRGHRGRPFLVAQAGDASPGTHWRVTVREIGSQISGGRFAP